MTSLRPNQPWWSLFTRPPVKAPFPFASWYTGTQKVSASRLRTMIMLRFSGTIFLGMSQVLLLLTLKYHTVGIRSDFKRLNPFNRSIYPGTSPHNFPEVLLKSFAKLRNSLENGVCFWNIFQNPKSQNYKAS